MSRFNRLTADQPNKEHQAHQDILEQERLRSQVTGWMRHNPEGQLHITEYFNDLHLIELLDKTARQLAATTEVPTTAAMNRAITRLTRTGKAIIALCNAFDPDLPARHRHHVFNPWIQAMVDALHEWYPGDGFGKERPGVGVSRADRVRLGRMARYVRQTCQSRVFERRVQDERKLALQNYNSACSYLTWLFMHYSRLLILRIDLYYHGEGRELAGTKEAQAAFERFVRMLRVGRIVPDVVGYLFSREVGPERGVHFHVMVILDGHKRKDANGHTQTIGGRWVKDYTATELGSFFNCYARRHEYEYNGLGLVHVSDWQKLIGVCRAIKYMTKSEYLIKIKIAPKKCFRRGNLWPNKTKRGAPRQSGHDMSTVCRILGAAGTACRQR